MRRTKDGVIQAITSGILWASYSITLFSVLSPFNGDTGTLDSAKGIMFIILSAIGIAWIDALITGVFEIGYCYQQGKFKTFLKELKSPSLFKIMPAALFAGPLGLVPFAIASRYSVSVAMSITAFYPVLGSIIALFWFKDRLSPVKFLGILFAVSGIVVISGFSGLHIIGIVLAIVASVGYSLELVFGYRLMAEDVDPVVSLALKQVSAIIIYTIMMIILLVIPGNFEFFTNLVSMIDFNTEFDFTHGVLGNTTFIILVFILASFFNAAAYVFYFRGMNNAGVSTASSLNIAYGIWTIIILALPPFFMTPAISSVIGAVLTFTGSVIVIIESNRLEKKYKS
ncbi:hypothetical protein [Zophobihabitans entericus]|uniref:EamA-like transporter family protein n=1 Tax=Zophobihabitans entericus TaxID=1635327 RepID=A0A6G9I8P5_9GAMM|nr:hypothetical protein [Zophobihabitans entericus]QIQ20585.1 hypothetical protein IPMB12_02130 [Zophobihabitans entericus]